MGLREDLQAELVAAMRRRDAGVVAALRTTLAALANAEAVPVPSTAASTHDAPAPPPSASGSGAPVPTTSGIGPGLPASPRSAGTLDAPAGPGEVGNEHFAGSVAGLGAAEVERAVLSEDQQRRLVAAEAAQLDQHAARLGQACRLDEADAARRAARTLAAVLGRAAQG